MVPRGLYNTVSAGIRNFGISSSPAPRRSTGPIPSDGRARPLPLLFSGLSEVSLFRRAEFGGRSLECWRTGRVAWAVMSVSLA